jgi:hypothetical protein
MTEVLSTASSVPLATVRHGSYLPFERPRISLHCLPPDGRVRPSPPHLLAQIRKTGVLLRWGAHSCRVRCFWSSREVPRMMGLPPYSEMRPRPPWSPLPFASGDHLPLSARREREDEDKRRRRERCGVRNTCTLRQWIGCSVVLGASALCSSSTSKLASIPLFRLLTPIIIVSSLRAECPFFLLPVIKYMWFYTL